MAISVELGPGIRLVAPTISRNSWSLSHPRRRTTSSRIIAMCAAGPPKAMQPNLKKRPATSLRCLGENVLASSVGKRPPSEEGSVVIALRSPGDRMQACTVVERWRARGCSSASQAARHVRSRELGGSHGGDYNTHHTHDFLSLVSAAMVQ